MRALTTVLLLLIAVPAAAQEQEIRSANLPRQLEWELLRMYDGAAERYDGPVTIGASEVVNGDVAAMGGPLRIAGRVEGDVAMVDGDVLVEPGGVVTGDVTVVGGEVRMLGDGAEVLGSITAYGPTLGRSDEDDRWSDGDQRWRDRDGRWDRGHSTLTVRVGSSYNRVEGLPIMFGPVIRTAGPDALRLEALAIWRTESGGPAGDRMGYRVRAEQLLDGGRLGVGGSVYSVVAPLDPWRLGDLEASLAAVVLHEDYRDHFERTGWDVFATVRPTDELEATLRYRQERHASVAPGDPWALFNRSDLWRVEPVIGEGDIRTLVGALEFDLRDDDEDPARGWLARFSVECPVGGTLTRPALLLVRPENGTVVSDVLAAEELDTDFVTGLLDVRRYMPVSYASQLNVRVVAGGGLSAGPLPAQYQHALGGIGTLPGFPTFAADCGARRATGRLGQDRFYTRYGCDRFVLGQVEYRGDLSLDFGVGAPDFDDEDDGWGGVEIDFSPTWVVFFDAARGWSYGDPLSGVGRETGPLYDAGVGLLFDDLGFYVAVPLNGDVAQEPRFLIRLGQRF